MGFMKLGGGVKPPSMGVPTLRTLTSAMATQGAPRSKASMQSGRDSAFSGQGPLRSLENKPTNESPLTSVMNEINRRIEGIGSADAGQSYKAGWQGIPNRMPEMGVNLSRGMNPGQSGNKGWQQGDVTSGGVPARKAPLAADSGDIRGQYIEPMGQYLPRQFSQSQPISPLMQLLMQYQQQPSYMPGMSQGIRG